jgi:hypothetical protein
VSDLERFLRGLDETAPPDLRGRIHPRPPSPEDDRPRGRWVTIAVALTISASVLVWAAQPFDGSSAGSSPSSTPTLSPVPEGRLSVSGPIENGRLRCTASLPTSVPAGEDTDSTFDVRNISDHDVDVASGVNAPAGTLRIYRGDTLLVDSADAHNGIAGPPPLTEALPRGEVTQLGAWNTAVLWSGPLRVVPVCAGTELPAVEVQVLAPGEAPDADLAVQRAVAAIGDPLTDCLPVTDGRWVTGVIHRGRPPSDESFDARCGARVLVNPGFDVVVVAIVAPPEAPDVDLTTFPSKIDALPRFDLPQDTPIAVSWWVYVVRADAIVKVTQRSFSLNCEGAAETSGGGIASCRFPTISAS